MNGTVNEFERNEADEYTIRGALLNFYIWYWIYTKKVLKISQFDKIHNNVIFW